MIARKSPIFLRSYIKGLKILYLIKRVNESEYVERIVKQALAKYDADKTGLFDFALESAGGSIVSTRYN